MITLILFLTTLFLMGWFIYSWTKDCYWEWFEIIFFPLIIGIACLFVSAGIITLLYCNFKIEDHRVQNTVQIYSIKNTSEIHGDFCLGSGSIDSSEYYYAFQKYPDNSLKRISFRVEDSFLYQDTTNGEVPYVDWQTIVYRAPKWLSFWPHFYTEDRTYYYVHVPTNTVVEQFQID